MSSFTKYFVNTYKNNYANFSGRARREEYWMFTLFHILVSIALVAVSGGITSMMGDSGLGGLSFILVAIYLLASFIPSLALGVRRLHDTDKSGWLYLIGFIPFGSIVLLVFFCLDGTPGPNKYGPNPKGIGGNTSDHLVSD